MNNPAIISRVLASVCLYTDQDEDDLCDTRRWPHDVVMARSLWFTVLHDTYGMEQKYIAHRTGFSTAAVHNGIKRWKESLGTDDFFFDAYTNVLLDIIRGRERRYVRAA